MKAVERMETIAVANTTLHHYHEQRMQSIS
ncbi:hypothetical protein MM817_00486 [Acidibacillus sp. S0AB]|uniref:Uncharacterized protein n=1 Tax=Sulfoacidibacillus ferrooxidans TaxID=2005001 RepID=A0A9X2ACE4_9BACL|nr:hypothetical protein [Sulfoacidibacillus ferrooxidans]